MSHRDSSLLPPAELSGAELRRPNLKAVLTGVAFTVELKLDGTATVRDRHIGIPTEITSSAAAKIEREMRRLLDQMAGAAIETPAPWNDRPGLNSAKTEVME